MASWMRPCEWFAAVAVEAYAAFSVVFGLKGSITGSLYLPASILSCPALLLMISRERKLAARRRPS